MLLLKPFANMNAKAIVIVSRSSDRGAIGYDEMYTSHLDADIVVNTSPVGMYPNITNAPIDVSWFRKLECVLDVVYNPILTRLCSQAQEARHQTCNWFGNVDCTSRTIHLKFSRTCLLMIQSLMKSKKKC